MLCGRYISLRGIKIIMVVWLQNRHMVVKSLRSSKHVIFGSKITYEVVTLY